MCNPSDHISVLNARSDYIFSETNQLGQLTFKVVGSKYIGIRSKEVKALFMEFIVIACEIKIGHKYE